MNIRLLCLYSALLMIMSGSCYSITQEPGGYPLNCRTHHPKNQVFNYSQASVGGKFNIFILGTSWCGPCKELKERLLTAEFDSSLVELHYVYCEGHNKWQSFRQSKTYFAYLAVENLQEWPQVIITSPLGNLIKRFDSGSLRNSGSTNSVFLETVSITEELCRNLKEYGNWLGTPISKDPIWMEFIEQQPVATMLPERNGSNSGVQCFNLECSTPVINYERVARKGRISLFIIDPAGSDTWDDFRDHFTTDFFSLGLIDIYFFDLSDVPHEKDIRENKRYMAALTSEQCLSCPEIVVVNPAGNIISRVSDQSEKSGKNVESLFDETILIIRNLSENIKLLTDYGFSDPMVIDSFWDALEPVPIVSTNPEKPAVVAENVKEEETAKEESSKKRPRRRFFILF